MVVPKMLKSQAIEKLRTEVARLQAEAKMLFFDRMMYEINDSLTSILAITDVEPKDAIPKIKRYIHRINQSLSNTKHYQMVSSEEKKFNITNVLRNLVHVIGDNFKRSKVVTMISDLNAPVLGDQAKFEQLFFTIMVDILSRAEEKAEILLECKQKDEFAQMTILVDRFLFSEEATTQIGRITEEAADFKGRIQIVPQGNGQEITLKIPLQFSAVNLTGAKVKKESKEPASKG